MKRCTLFLLALLPLSAIGQTAAVNGFCNQGGTPALTQGTSSTNKLQGITPSCIVTVYFTGTGTQVPGSSIFKDSIGTVLGNPFTASANGQYLFYASAGVGLDVVKSSGTTDTDVVPGGGGTPGQIATTFAGATPQIQLTAAITAACTAGTKAVDARGFGTSSPVVSSTISLGCASGAPLEIMFDQATVWVPSGTGIDMFWHLPGAVVDNLATNVTGVSGWTGTAIKYCCTGYSSSFVAGGITGYRTELNGFSFSGAGNTTGTAVLAYSSAGATNYIDWISLTNLRINGGLYGIHLLTATNGYISGTRVMDAVTNGSVHGFKIDAPTGSLGITGTKVFDYQAELGTNTLDYIWISGAADCYGNDFYGFHQWDMNTPSGGQHSVLFDAGCRSNHVDGFIGAVYSNYLDNNGSNYSFDDWDGSFRGPFSNLNAITAPYVQITNGALGYRLNGVAALNGGGGGTTINSVAAGQPVSLYNYAGTKSFQLADSGTVILNGSTILPSTLTGYFGTAGVDVQLSDGTGAGDVAAFKLDGTLSQATGDQARIPFFCQDLSGSGTAQSCNTSPTFVPVDGDCIIYVASQPNSGASLTVNVNSLGVKSVQKWLTTTTLAAGDMQGNAPQFMCYNGAVWNVFTIGNPPVGSGTFNALSGDATSTATGGATTVKGINGTLLSGLATGILKNTTGTGVPSIAVATDLPTIPLTGLASQAANTVVGNGTGSTAVPTALTMPSCSTGTSALTWTSGTGFGCNSISGVPSQYKTWSCQPGLGDGTNAITAATYLQSTCKNTTGVTVTITGVQCFTDNSGSSTMNAAGNTLGALLTGAVSCTSSFAAGTQSANVALTNGDYIKFTFVADGTSKQTTWIITGTY